MRQEDKNINFIKKSILIHSEGLFDYTNVKYINTTTQVKLTCNKHNLSFMITPVAHFKGIGGCSLCYEELQRLYHKNKTVGQKFTTNEGYEIEIIDYITSTNCTIAFNDGTVLKTKAYNDIKRGQIKNPNRIIKLGVGYIGIGNFSSTRHLEAYKKWYNMLNRSYNDTKEFKSYKDVTVCAEWHNFQNFAQWFYENYNPEYMQKWQLDKDILAKGNKTYSPKTCCFVPQEINSLFLKSNSTRGLTPVGTNIVRNAKYTARYKKDDKVIHLGTFDTPEEAFECYKFHKEKYIKEVADKWKDQITKQTYKALINYKVEIDD